MKKLRPVFADAAGRVNIRCNMLRNASRVAKCSAPNTGGLDFVYNEGDDASKQTKKVTVRPFYACVRWS